MIPNAGRNWTKLLILGIVWGASFLFSAIALRDFGPMTIASVRISLGAVLLVAVSYAIGSGLPKWNGPNGRLIWAIAAALGLLSNALPFALLNWGQTYVASGFAGVCMAVVPLLVLPMAHVFVPGERLSLRKSAGFLIGFVGVLILIGPEALDRSGSDLELLGRLACVAAAACYAVGAIITRRCPEVDRIALAAAVLLCGAVMSLPLAWINEGMPAQITLLPTLSLLFLAIFPTALAQIFLVQVIRDAGPSFFTLVNYQVPIWSVILGIVFLNEPAQSTLFIALALILIGLVISQFNTLKSMVRG